MDSSVWSTLATPGSSSSKEPNEQTGCATSRSERPLGMLTHLKAPFSKGYLQGHPTGYLQANPGVIAATAESRHDLERLAHQFSAKNATAFRTRGLLQSVRLILRKTD